MRVIVKDWNNEYRVGTARLEHQIVHGLVCEYYSVHFTLSPTEDFLRGPNYKKMYTQDDFIDPVVFQLQVLPAFVVIEDYEFSFWTFNDGGNEIRMCYRLISGTWVNRFYRNNEVEFLCMVENITSQDDFVNGLFEIYCFLINKNLIHK